MLSQMAFMLKQKKEARKKRREGAKEGEKADDHGLDDHHGLLVHLPHRGHLFTCLTIRCFRPMHKDLPRVISEIYDMVGVRVRVWVRFRVGVGVGGTPQWAPRPRARAAASCG